MVCIAESSSWSAPCPSRQRDRFRHQRGAGSEFASADQECSSYRYAMNSGYPQPIKPANESTRIKFWRRDRSDSFR
jgi:hypothetical protein